MKKLPAAHINELHLSFGSPNRFAAHINESHFLLVNREGRENLGTFSPLEKKATTKNTVGVSVRFSLGRFFEQHGGS